MSNRSLYAQTAIVGIGESDYPALYRNPDPTRTKEELAVASIRKAIEDAGLKKDQIDGLIMTGMPRYEPLMFRTGLQDVRFLAQHPSSGRMPPIALAHACMAVMHGLADYVLLVHSVNFRSASASFGGGVQESGPSANLGDLYDLAFGMTSPGAFYALALSRYLEAYGRDESELAEIPMTIRRHASLNPNAIMQTPYDLDDYLGIRYISRPLRLYDYCLVNDGAVAMIVTTAERAKDLPQPPVYVASVAERACAREWYVDDQYWRTACQSLKTDLFDSVGMQISDIDSVQAYDNFSPSALWILEGYGFAPIGEGLDWVKGGRIGLGGELPLNTNGGMLSEAYLQGWNAHVESVKQLRGQAGARQVEDCNAILYTCLSIVPGGDILVNENFLG